MLVINNMPDQIELDSIRQLQKIEVATIGHFSDSLVSAESLQVNYQNARFAGTAVTVSIEDEDSAVLHHTLDQLRPNDLLVVNINPQIIRSCWGLIMHMFATNKQISGVIMNGNITDIYSIRNNGVPIAFNRATAKIFRSSAGKHGEVNTPLTISGVTINPGDAVVVDECGFAAIHPAELSKVITESLEIQAKEPSLIYSMIDKKIGLLSGATDKIMNTLQSQGSK